MLTGIEQESITLYDASGERVDHTYSTLRLEMGQGRWISLAEALAEEADRVAAMHRHAERICSRIEALSRYHERIERDRARFLAQRLQRAEGFSSAMSPEARVKLLNSYYTLDRGHERVLEELVTHLLAGSDGDYTAHMISLFQYAIDLVCRLTRGDTRKTGRPAAFHPLEAARGAAKNGQHPVTILATLLHDVVEDRVAGWLHERVLADLTARGETRDPGPEDRARTVRERIDEYNDVAAGTFYGIGLFLASHVLHFPRPDTYYQVLHSTMEALANLSRTPDTTYYSYLKQLLYPKYGSPDAIRRSSLVSVLRESHPDPEPLLDHYLEQVDGFYQTGVGEFYSQEELKRNAFREILSKILDRLNNTRDMERADGFSVASRLYGAGFKNLYFAQAIEGKLSRPGLPFVERRLIEAKFLNKPKIAALYQVLVDTDLIEGEWLGRETVAGLRQEIEKYKATGGFTRLTTAKGAFDGLVALFNNITLGHKDMLAMLEQDRGLQAECLIAFKAVLEWMIAMPALLRREVQEQGLENPRDSRFARYRIRGLGPQLEERGRGPKGLAAEDVQIKTFKRRVID